MKLRTASLLAFALVLAPLGTSRLAAAQDSGVKIELASQADSAWLAKARAAYPLTTCLVSGDKLDGDMGGPKEFVIKREGKPDQLIRFCCKDCIKDFKKDPAKYLSELNAAEAKAKK